MEKVPKKTVKPIKIKLRRHDREQLEPVPKAHKKLWKRRRRRNPPASAKKTRHRAVGGRSGSKAGQHLDDQLSGGRTPDGGKTGIKARNGDNGSVGTDYKESDLTGPSRTTTRGTSSGEDSRAVDPMVQKGARTKTGASAVVCPNTTRNLLTMVEMARRAGIQCCRSIGGRTMASW